MSDNSVKGSSCLAITEKRNKNSNQKPGGCIGIFFQLVDWNKRLTKKKFFSKKLLPLASGKQGSSKKFKGDEKMPNSKLHLIANENNGGFPSAKKGKNHVIEVEQKHEMRVPSLVARLMGLESIPASLKDKDGEADKQGIDLEIGTADARHDLRPQKLQKTGAHERRAVTKFGAEDLQIKSVLSQVRKYNHPKGTKYISPLKSPRVSSGKSASRSSRLIEAATKILEPGLPATSRAKCSLTSSTSIYHPNNGIVSEMVENRPVDIHDRFGYDACIDKSLVRQTSCKTCGNLLDVEISTPIVSEQKERSFILSHENDVVLLRNQEKKIITLVNEDDKKKTHSWNESTIKRMPVPEKWDSSRQPSRALEDDETSFTLKHKTQTQELLLRGERIPYVSRTSNMQEKRVSFAARTEIALNRNLSDRTRTRMRSPTKVESCKFDLERKPLNRHDNSLFHLGNIERRKRTPNVLSKVEGTSSVNVNLLKHRNVSSDAQVGKRRNFDASSPNKSNVKSKRGGHLKTDNIDDNKVASSTSINCSYDQPEQLEHDAELLDSATSFNKGKVGFEKLIELINQIHRILQSLNSFWPRLTESKLTYMKEVIFNAELVLGNVTRPNEDRVQQLLISCILLNELDTMVSDAMWIHFNGFVNCEESKNGNQLKGFLFDCVIEYLESNYCQKFYSLFKSWSTCTKLPLCMKAEKLVQEVKREIKKWACTSGMLPEQILEWEMSHSLGKWNDFNIEEFEAGVDIDGEVLQILIDEVVEDLMTL